MSGDTPWRVVAKKVRGASHVRADLENQDSIGWLPKSGSGPGVTVTVADGHGSQISVRSATGAGFAVGASHELSQELIEFAPEGAERSLAKQRLEERAGEQLVRRWRELVAIDLEKYPLRDDEFEAAGEKGKARLKDDPVLAYGSTVVTAVATETFMAFWQLGDGDIVVVGADGRAFRPLPDDPNLFANATTSLCSDGAARFFRSAWWSGKSAPLVLASTDGLSNSYETDEDFLAFGPDILKRVTAEGLDAVAGRLTEWLQIISERGSGDDMSLGLIYRPETVPESAGGEP